VKTIPIDLPRHRLVETREMERYFELVTEVRETLRGSETEGPAGEASRRVSAEGLA
jgi:hypothetical protein